MWLAGHEKERREGAARSQVASQITQATRLDVVCKVLHEHGGALNASLLVLTVAPKLNSLLAHLPPARSVVRERGCAMLHID